MDEMDTRSTPKTARLFSLTRDSALTPVAKVHITARGTTGLAEVDQVCALQGKEQVHNHGTVIRGCLHPDCRAPTSSSLRSDNGSRCTSGGSFLLTYNPSHSILALNSAALEIQALTLTEKYPAPLARMTLKRSKDV